MGLIVVLVGAGAFFLLRGGDGGSGSAVQGSGYASLIGRGPEGRIEEQWSQRMDGYPSSVTIHDGTVFVAESDGSDRVTISALDLGGDGAERWSERLEGFEGWLYAHSDLLVVNTGGEVTALDPRSGEEQWSAEGNWSRLDLADLVVVVDDSETIAYDRDGERRWRTRGYATGACDGMVLVSDVDSTAAVQASDGSEAWSVDGSSGACGDGAAFVHDDGRLRAVDSRTGEERWNVRRSEFGSTLVHDGLLLVTGDGEMTAYQISNGDERWSADTDDVGLPVGRAGGNVITVGDGRLRKIDPSSGDEVQNVRIGSSEVLVGENLVIAAEESVITAYSTSDFDELWDLDVDGYDSPMAMGEGWVVGVEGDEVVAYR